MIYRLLPLAVALAGVFALWRWAVGPYYSDCLPNSHLPPPRRVK